MTSLAPKSTQPRAVILCAADGSATSKEAVLAAARFAALPGTELHLVHVAPADAKGKASVIDAAQAMLANEAVAAGIVEPPHFHVVTGAPWREIIQLAADLRADLIVVGTHGRSGLERMMLGSVAEQVVNKAPCPVHVARKKDYSAMAPEIEPPCPECLTAQETSRGQKLWCERHEGRRTHGRLHYEIPKGYGGGSQLIRP